jgi:curved DNA-binding protein CbpA
MARAVVIEDYYSILEVPHFASPESLRESYKRLALRYHPDKNRDDTATSDFQKLVIAWEVLKDPKTREEYDKEYLKLPGRSWEEAIAEEARQRWREINIEARAQWDRQRGSSADEALRKEKARVWKEAARNDYVDRLRKWTDFRNGHLGRIEDYQILLRRHQTDLDAQTRIGESDIIRQFEQAIECSKALGRLNYDHATTLSKLMEGRNIYIGRLAKAIEEVQAILKQLVAELECGRRKYEEAEAQSREHRIREALGILGPRDMNPPLFCMIDRRGRAISYWKSLSRVQSGPKCFSSLEGSSEGPWHHPGEWERVVGEHRCRKCDQSAFHIIPECGPAKCQYCGMVICNSCYRDLKRLRDYHEWMICSPDDQSQRGSLFSLDFDASPEPPNIHVGAPTLFCSSDISQSSYRYQ